MATKFYLPDGSTTDIVGLSLPVFFVRDPAGRIFIDGPGDAEEWLASYYTQEDL